MKFKDDEQEPTASAKVPGKPVTIARNPRVFRERVNIEAIVGEMIDESFKPTADAIDREVMGIKPAARRRPKKGVRK